MGYKKVLNAGLIAFCIISIFAASHVVPLYKKEIAVFILFIIIFLPVVFGIWTTYKYFRKKYEAIKDRAEFSGAPPADSENRLTYSLVLLFGSVFFLLVGSLAFDGGGWFLFAIGVILSVYTCWTLALDFVTGVFKLVVGGSDSYYLLETDVMKATIMKISLTLLLVLSSVWCAFNFYDATHKRHLTGKVSDITINVTNVTGYGAARSRLEIRGYPLIEYKDSSGEYRHFTQKEYWKRELDENAPQNEIQDAIQSMKKRAIGTSIDFILRTGSAEKEGFWNRTGKFILFGLLSFMFLLGGAAAGVSEKGQVLGSIKSLLHQ